MSRKGKEGLCPRDGSVEIKCSLGPLPSDGVRFGASASAQSELPIPAGSNDMRSNDRCDDGLLFLILGTRNTPKRDIEDETETGNHRWIEGL